MNVWKSLAGMAEAELISADVPAALDALERSGIQLYGIVFRDQLTVRFQLDRKNVGKLKQVTEKRGNQIKIIRNYGLYWTFRRTAGRPVLLGVTAGIILLACLIPTRIFFVEVEGNKRIPSRQILDAADQCGLHFGSSRRQLRSERMKNALLSYLPDLQWAGVNTRGCVAVISVTERAPAAPEEHPLGISHIVASRDGVVLSATVTRGNGLCRTGRAVKAGEILISGYTDCGLRITATRAEGEVLAATNRHYSAVTPAVTGLRGETGRKHTSYCLRIGKKRINFYKGSGIWDTRCDKMIREYKLTLPGGFLLPISLVRQTYVAYPISERQKEGEKTGLMLNDFVCNHLKKDMIAGNIVTQKSHLTSDGDLFRLDGDFWCTEMIGRVRNEQIGEYHGETD